MPSRIFIFMCFVDVDAGKLAYAVSCVGVRQTWRHKGEVISEYVVRI